MIKILIWPIGQLPYYSVPPRMDQPINFLGNFEVNTRRRQQISVESLGLKRELKDWRSIQTPELTCKLLGIELVNVLNRDGLVDFMLHIVRIDRSDLMKVILNTGEMSLLYCSTELNKCYSLAKSDDIRKVLKEKLRDFEDSQYDIPY